MKYDQFGNPILNLPQTWGAPQNYGYSDNTVNQQPLLDPLNQAPPVSLGAAVQGAVPQEYTLPTPAPEYSLGDIAQSGFNYGMPTLAEGGLGVAEMFADALKWADRGNNPISTGIQNFVDERRESVQDYWPQQARIPQEEFYGITDPIINEATHWNPLAGVNLQNAVALGAQGAPSVIGAGAGLVPAAGMMYNEAKMNAADIPDPAQRGLYTAGTTLGNAMLERLGFLGLMRPGMANKAIGIPFEGAQETGQGLLSHYAHPTGTMDNVLGESAQNFVAGTSAGAPIAAPGLTAEGIGKLTELGDVDLNNTITNLEDQPAPSLENQRAVTEQLAGQNIRVVQSPQQMDPVDLAAAQSEANRQSIDLGGGVEGMVVNGNTYVFTDTVTDPGRAQEVAGHETTHTGLAGLAEKAGVDVGTYLQDIYQAKQAEVDAWAANSAYADASPEVQLEEYVANLAEESYRTGKINSALNRLIAGLRAGLKKVGYTGKTTNRDILNLIRNARSEAGVSRETAPRAAYAGERSKTADTDALAQAKKQLREEEKRVATGLITEDEYNQNAERIRQDTGWHQAKDGRWRYEIDDSKAQFNVPEPEVSKYTGKEYPPSIAGRKLGDVLDHPELFEAYPDLKDIIVDDIPESLKGRQYGSYGQVPFMGEEIRVETDPQQTDFTGRSPKKSAMHEVQHAIQQREGFAKGSSPDIEQGEASKQHQVRMPAYQYALTQRMMADVARMGEDVNDPETHNVIQREMGKKNASPAVVRKAIDDYLSDPKTPEEYDRLTDEARERLDKDASASERYFRQHGEIEARDVERRIDKTPEERKAEPPMQADPRYKDPLTRFSAPPTKTDLRQEPVRFSKGTAPKKTQKAYKLFRTMKTKPGIYPLFIGKSKPTPVGEWIDAEFIPTKGFSERPGWHVGVLPTAPHLMKKDGTMQEGRVWAEVEIPADVNWQDKADQEKTGDIRGEVPKGGHYRFKRPMKQGGEWMIAGSLKVNRILSEEEADQIAREGVKNLDDKGRLISGKTNFSAQNPRFQAAWHGTPHDVDKFSTEKIGSGEGAQVYGHGLYFAERKEVAEWYKKNLSESGVRLDGRNIESIESDEWSNAEGERLDDLRAANYLLGKVADDHVSDPIKSIEYDLSTGEGSAKYKERAQRALDLVEEGRLKIDAGNLYKVELAPKENEYLLWDKPLAEQPPVTRRAFKDFDMAPGMTDAFKERLTNNLNEYAEIVRASEEMGSNPNTRSWDNVKSRLASAFDIINNDGDIKQLGDDLQFLHRTLDGIRAIAYPKREEFPEQYKLIRERTEGFPKVKSTKSQLGFIRGIMHSWSHDDSGKDMYKALSKSLGSDKAASDALHAKGVRGVKYLDGSSRRKGEGHHNYVIFNDEDVEITARFSAPKYREGGIPSPMDVNGKQVEFEEYIPAIEVAQKYAESAGIPYDRPTGYVKLDTDRAARIADEFERMEHRPNDPDVKAAYEALAEETVAQFEALLDTGIKLEFNPEGVDPYPNPREMTIDVIENNHMYVYPTEEGFGSSEFDPTGSPMLDDTDFVTDGKVWKVNDMFRAVHDYFGHVKTGAGFRSEGEENAWQSHINMYSDKAAGAATTETRGQNSWLNFGPHGEKNRNAKVEDTVFADQKIGLMPEWTWTEGRSSERAEAQKDQDQEEGQVQRDTTAGTPATDGRGESAPESGQRQGEVKFSAIFASPNEQDESSYADALREVKSDDQRLFKLYGEEIDDLLGLKATESDAIGDWEDGAEASLVTQIDGPVDMEKLKLAAALKGVQANQKATLVFSEEEGGPHKLIEMVLPVEMAEARDILSEAGLGFRTMVPDEKGTKVMIVDDTPDLSAMDAVETIGANYDIDEITITDGTSDIVGDPDSRREGVKIQRQVIKSYLQKNEVSPELRDFAQNTFRHRGRLDDQKRRPDVKTRRRMKKFMDEVDGAKGIMPHLTTQEKEQLVSKKSARTMMDFYRQLPSAKEMASVAWAGRAKKGWYKRSANALIEVFGYADASRFAALLAAMSPQTGVPANLENALNVWVNWNKAGRPQSRSEIKKIMGQSVQGDKGEDSVLDAWLNNSVYALTNQDGEYLLSGPKVNSFMENLVKNVSEVTNDTWQANYMGIPQQVFAGAGRKIGDRKGVGMKGGGYLAANAVTRQAAKILSKRTGETWTPDEIQETVWSWARTLKNAAKAESKTAEKLLAEAGLTHDMISDTEDFELLFLHDVYRNILEKGGYDEKIDKLRTIVSKEDRKNTTGRTDNYEDAGVSPEVIQRDLRRAAKRLDRTKED